MSKEQMPQMPDFPLVRAGEAAEQFDRYAFTADMPDAYSLSARKHAVPETPLSPVMQDLGLQRNETGGTNPPIRHFGKPDSRPVSPNAGLSADEAREKTVTTLNEASKIYTATQEEKDAADYEGQGIADARRQIGIIATGAAQSAADNDPVRHLALLRARESKKHVQ